MQTDTKDTSDDQAGTEGAAGRPDGPDPESALRRLSPVG